MTPHPVITGLGPISGLGIGAGQTHDALAHARSAVAPIEDFDASGFPSPLGAQLGGFKVTDHVPKSYRKATKVMARDTALAVAAAAAAVEDAGLRTRAHADDGLEPTYEPHRLACSIGAGLISADTVELATALASSINDNALDLAHWGREGMGNLTPLWMLKYLPNMLACHVTIIHGARGPSNTLVCGEASGLLSIAEAVRVLERGGADAALAGGVESKLNPMGMARMFAYGRLVTGPAPDEPWRAVRPYDPEGNGCVLGEGGAIFVIEPADRARERGATTYASVSGQGSSQASPDHRALGVTGPGDAATTGRGPNTALVDAIDAALRSAGLTPADIDLIVPQGLGVPSLDTGERLALARVFEDRLAEIPLATVTPFVGDLVAGAGAFQTYVAAHALHTQGLPARLHAGVPDASVRAGATEPTAATIRHALVCTNSLGGQCAALVLSQAISA